MTTAEKTAAEAFCAAAAAQTAETRAAADRAFRASATAAKVSFRETRAAAARASETARRAAEKAEALLDGFDPAPYSNGPGGLFDQTFQAIMAAHMALDSAARRAAFAARCAWEKV